MHAQRALGRWARLGSDKTKAAVATCSAGPHSASEAPIEHSMAHTAPASVHSPFAEMPAREPSPGRQAAPSSSAAACQEEHPAAGNGHLIAASHSSQHGERGPLPPNQAEQLDPTAINKAHSTGVTPAGSPAFQPRSSVMSSPQSTGELYHNCINCLVSMQCAYKTCRLHPPPRHASKPLRSSQRECCAEGTAQKHALTS